MSALINGPYGISQYEDFTQDGYTGDCTLAAAGKVYYPNYKITFNLSQTDFGQSSDGKSSLASFIDTLNGNINGVFDQNEVFRVAENTVLNYPYPATAGTPEPLLTVPFELSGLTGWAYLFVFNFCAYFKFSPNRIYNLSVNTNLKGTQETNTPADKPSYKQNLLGVGIPTQALTENGGQEYSGVTITFFIHNKTPTEKDKILANDFLPAVILGEWMTSYLKKFKPNETPGWDAASPAIPEPSSFTELFDNAGSNANILKGIPWVPINIENTNGNLDIEESNKKMNELIFTTNPPTMNNKALPDLDKQVPVPPAGFTSKIPYIIKRFRNRNLTEHLDGGDTTSNTVTGTIIYEEKCDDFLTPLNICPWFKRTDTTIDTLSTQMPVPTTTDVTKVTFYLTPDDFNVASGEKPLENIWINMGTYLNTLTGYTLFSKPKTIPDSDLSDNKTAQVGFIEALLDVYSEILQVSSTRFVVLSVTTSNSEETAEPSYTTAAFKKIKVIIDVNNIIPTNPKLNDFLDSAILAAWLTNYWTSYQGTDSTLPLFMPPPINISNSGSLPVTPDTNTMPALGSNYNINYRYITGSTPRYHCLTAMINPIDKFTGNITINPNMIKLASRIKNIKLGIKNNGKVEKFGNFNRKLIENVSGGISTSRGSTRTSGSTNTPPPNNKQMFEPGSSTTYSILDYIFQFSYITCFVAAVILSIYQLTGLDIIQKTLNDSFTYYIYTYIGICSIIALFSWFNTSIWYVDSNIVNSNNVAISVTNTHLF